MNERSDILDPVRRGRLLFDGAMGSMLISKGLPAGVPPELWNLSRPSAVRSLHEAYLQAGARVITTNTFGATPGKLASHGLEDRMEAINTSAVSLAREAIDRFMESAAEGPPEKRFVAFSVGPTGIMLPPVGDGSAREMRAQFEAQIACVAGNIDLVLIETMYDLREGLLALEAARSSTDAPVALTLTLERKPRGFFTIMGNEACSAVAEAERAGADIAGANCTLSSADMLDLARLLREHTPIPVLCQPNAGMPAMRNGVPVYGQEPEEFAGHAAEMISLGVNCVGGCCGTTPEFIREAARRICETTEEEHG